MKPEVGMGITECIGSDRYPGTIVRVSKSGKSFWYTRDEFWAGPGHAYYGNQNWEYSSNPVGPHNPEIKAKQYLRADDTIGWKRGAERVWIRVGIRDAYQDPSF